MKKHNKVKKQKRFITGEERCLLFNLYHNGLFYHKIISNKKKKIKKFNWKKDIADYLNIKKNNIST